MSPALRSVLVVGTGLIGTSVGLALRRHDVAVHLWDRDPGVARRAAALGAGTITEVSGDPDLVVLGVPPEAVPGELLRVQRRYATSICTDVSSAQSRVHRRARASGCDLRRYVGGHPMAGRELPGPEAALADLFEGRAWVLVAPPEAQAAAVQRVAELAELCGARVLPRDPEVHDRAVAAVSHLPQLLASTAAAALADLPEDALELAGPGVRDVTRIAASDPHLWAGILRANAAELVPLVEAAVRQLTSVTSALREEAKGNVPDAAALGPAEPAESAGPPSPHALDNLLRRGNQGRARLSSVLARRGATESGTDRSGDIGPHR